MNLTVEQWLAVITFLGGIIFALMKFYHVFSQLEDSMKELKEAVERLNNHEIRISRLEEQNKTLFRGIGGNKMINWKSRIKNKQFWLSIIPAVLLLIQVVAVPFGYKFQIEMINKQLLDVVNALFVVLTILGIVTDPTTPGLSDRKGDK